MPIVTISRGSYYHGKSIAEKLAARLGYTCISRDAVLDGLEEFHLPELKLVRCLNDTFSVLDRFPHGKQRFIAAVRAALLERFTQGNVVYHGLVGHYFVRDISHVFKIRIIADTERRIADEMAREQISAEQARYILKKDDEERRKWSMFLYGIDITNEENYNMTLRIGHLQEDEAVEILANAVTLPAFQETPDSTAMLADAALAAQITHRLLDYPNAMVNVKGRQASISMKVPESQKPLIEDRIGEMLAPISGLAGYAIRFENYY